MKSKVFKIKEVETLRDSLSDGSIKTFLNNYCKSINGILYAPNIPYICMIAGYEKALLKYLPKAESPDLDALTNNYKNDPAETAKALVGHFEKKIKESQTESKEELSDKLSDFIANSPEFRKAYYSIIHNSLVNCWTIFEAISKDLWRYLLNKYPKKYLHSVISTNDSGLNSIDGMSGKQISISLLSKYDFDVSNYLGDLLSRKYDFTSPNGIKLAFQHLFQCKSESLNFLDHKDLKQLEVIRHMIVHNAGIMDEDYIKKTIYKDENIGDELFIEANQIDELVNSSIKATIGLFKLTLANV